MKLNTFIQKNDRKIQIFLFVFCFVALFININSMPFESDDLIYSCKWLSDQPLSSLKDIVEYQYHHYFEWGGRTVAHSLLQILFYIGKPISSLLLTATYFLISHLICKIAKVKNNAYELFVVGILFFMNPNFKETVVWYSGAANYLLTTAIVLLAFVPFAKRISCNECELSNLSPSRYTHTHTHACVVVAFLAGWCNENISTTFVLVELYVLYISYKKDHKIDWLLLVMLIGTVIGCMFLILAPGNFARSKVIVQSTVMSILYRGHGQVSAWFHWLLPTWIFYVASIHLLKVNGITESTLSKVCRYWAVASILIMVASPTYPDRATFGSFVILLIASIRNYSLCTTDECFVKKLSYTLAFSMGASNLAIGLVHLARCIGANIPG